MTSKRRSHRRRPTEEAICSYCFEKVYCKRVKSGVPGKDYDEWAFVNKDGGLHRPCEAEKRQKKLKFEQEGSDADGTGT